MHIPVLKYKAQLCFAPQFSSSPKPPDRESTPAAWVEPFPEESLHLMLMALICTLSSRTQDGCQGIKHTDYAGPSVSVAENLCVP